MAPQPQVTVINFLLHNGGLPYLGLGMFLSLIGVALVIIPKNRLAIIIYAFVSLLPGILAMFAIYSTFADFSSMALSATAPEPTEFAAVTARAISCGLMGILGTILPTVLAIIAFSRLSKLP